MKVCIINGSPHKNGNTSEVLKPFISRLLELGACVETIHLCEKKVSPCRGCYACQNVQNAYGCVQEDDAEEIFRQIGASDLVVFATPIYTWYCTAEMKALMDRHYGLNKYYGSVTGQLIPKISVALITTHGYEDDYANEPFEIGIKRWCLHCHWHYQGRYSVQDIDGMPDMKTSEAIKGAKRFAERLVEKWNVSRETSQVL